MRDGEKVGDLFGIRIETLGDCKLNLTQTGLMNKVLETANMEDSNSVPIPVSIVPLGIDTDGNNIVGDWDYTTVVEMLMYLA